jgi:hypothetical protein
MSHSSVFTDFVEYYIRFWPKIKDVSTFTRIVEEKSLRARKKVWMVSNV